MATMYGIVDRLIDRVAEQAVKLAELQALVDNLRADLAYTEKERDQVREERDCLVRDLRVRQIEARQGRERLETAEKLLEGYYALHHGQGVYSAGTPEAYQQIPFEPAITLTIE